MSDSPLQEKLRRSVALRSAALKQFLAEFLGTFLLVVFGDAAVAQSVLTNGAKGTFLSVNFGYGIGGLLGVMASGNISGGHINPAVTVALAAWGKFSWSKVPIYMVGQYLGGFVASAVIFAVYPSALQAYEEGARSLTTAGIWATYPGSLSNATGMTVNSFLTFGNGFGDQVVGTMLLLVCVCAITDHRNMGVPKNLIPLYVGLTILVLGISYGFNCGYAINPARDLAPRLFSLLAGWKESFSATTVDGVPWWWIPIVAPHIGGILGVAVYLFFIELHHKEEEKEDESGITIATKF